MNKTNMKDVFDSANLYIENCTWKDLSMLKVCLYSMGLLAGITMPKKYKKYVAACSTALFIATDIPLMIKYINTIKEYKEKKNDIE